MLPFSPARRTSIFLWLTLFCKLQRTFGNVPIKISYISGVALLHTWRRFKSSSYTEKPERTLTGSTEYEEPEVPDKGQKMWTAGRGTWGIIVRDEGRERHRLPWTEQVGTSTNAHTRVYTRTYTISLCRVSLSCSLSSSLSRVCNDP